jgi:1-phosphatidylinositol phosphodiesterase
MTLKAIVVGALLAALPGVAPAAQFSLLDENRESGGTLAQNSTPAAWLTGATADWMGKLPDSTSLARLSIPGTHDSGARHGGAACVTQSWSIADQLKAGIRFLDIRNRRTGASFAIHHGPCFQKIMFGDVLNDVRGFLRAHPGETILMRVKEEHSPQPGSDSFRTIWDGYMTRYGGLFAPALSSIPTLGQVRGKVVVLRNADIGAYGLNMHDSGKTSIQDAYKVYWLLNDNPFGAGTASLPQKKRLVREAIRAAETSSKLTLNHLSGAVGMIPRDVARATNADAYNAIGDYSGRKSVGVLIMDFPGEQMIYRTIKTNFVSDVMCGAKDWATYSAHSYARFSMPKSTAGTIIRIKGGAYNKYVFPKCNRATWTDLKFTCSAAGKWQKSGSWDADALCHSSNYDQRYLAVGSR